ncbi:hypothetical protein [Tropicimonas sp. IMCC6043]|uniref:hypothetical protein n=1 Tax=Tropicimonas sp. IMCC6043 TaxID=2510645 RepID=UPI00101B683B|nr:hypothetical protein [Tropicimonas sp. IMCC6043]RYH12246.1 hypothetical protein EU800_01400 [Tropicimonas sp. IMCC6043]
MRSEPSRGSISPHFVTVDLSDANAPANLRRYRNCPKLDDHGNGHRVARLRVHVFAVDGGIIAEP